MKFVKTFGRFIFFIVDNVFTVMCVKPHLFLGIGWNINRLHLLPSLSIEKSNMFEMRMRFLFFNLRIAI